LDSITTYFGHFYFQRSHRSLQPGLRPRDGLESLTGRSQISANRCVSMGIFCSKDCNTQGLPYAPVNPAEIGFLHTQNPGPPKRRDIPTGLAPVNRSICFIFCFIRQVAALTARPRACQAQQASSPAARRPPHPPPAHHRPATRHPPPAGPPSYHRILTGIWL
jgi:hypothetical protein